jgi:hypothetical protein
MTEKHLLELALSGIASQRTALDAQEAEIRAKLNYKRPVAEKGITTVSPKARTLSKAARAKISAAQKRRWAAAKKAKK